MNDKQAADSRRPRSATSPSARPNRALRVNAFVQQGCIGVVLRCDHDHDSEDRGPGHPDGAQGRHHDKRGLAIMVGGTGSGKSTTLAAMIGYRNETPTATSSPSRTRSSTRNPHKNSLITQREVAWTRCPGSTR